MTSTKVEPGPYDAFEKAEPREPLFVLLARDHASPGAITEWCRLRRNVATKTLDWESDAFAAEMRQCAEAEAVALEMNSWRTGQTVAATTAAPTTNYSGARGETLEHRNREIAIAEAVQHGREAAYHTCEMRDKLTGLGVVPELDTVLLNRALLYINNIADAHAPKRGREAA